MKKMFFILIAFSSMFFITGCGGKEISKDSWPNIYPVYNGKTDKIIKNNNNLELQGVESEEVKIYFETVKKEYSSMLVDSDTDYQATNSSGKMIILKYNKSKNTLEIKEG